MLDGPDLVGVERSARVDGQQAANDLEAVISSDSDGDPVPGTVLPTAVNETRDLQCASQPSTTGKVMHPNEDWRIAKESMLLPSVPEDLVETILSHTETRSSDHGTTIFLQGEPADLAFVFALDGPQPVGFQSRTALCLS